MDNNVCNATNTITEKNKLVTNVLEKHALLTVSEITLPVENKLISDNKLE